MNRQSFMIMYGKFATKMHSILQAKSADYAADSDPFQNFRLCEQLGISAERGILVRIMDKISRISNLIDVEAQVKDESVEDTLLDLANYALILACMLKERSDEKVSANSDKVSGTNSSKHCCGDQCAVGSCATRNTSKDN